MAYFTEARSISAQAPTPSLEVYVPVYGAGWESFLDSGPVYARIDARRFFALDVRTGPSTHSEKLGGP